MGRRLKTKVLILGALSTVFVARSIYKMEIYYRGEHLFQIFIGSFCLPPSKF
jgi:hypothetical protein